MFTANHQLAAALRHRNTSALGLLVYINPVVRYVTICVLSYGYGTTSGGSSQPWSADVFQCQKAAAN